MVNVLTADYEAIDTERQIEDAIERDPCILFPDPVSLLARQHHIYDDVEGRHVVDLVFHDPSAGNIILVELKRSRLEPGHLGQLRRYLDHARESPLVRSYLDAGSSLRGILASPEPGNLKPGHGDMAVSGIDGKKVIRILRELRQERLGGC